MVFGNWEGIEVKNFYESKYGIKEDKITEKFHKSRRMFVIKDNKLYITRSNLSYSHAVWFEKKDWINKENDSIMKNLVRGFIDKNKDIYFYVGYNFKLTKNAERVFFKFLPKLIKKLNLSEKSKIFGGRKKESENFIPIKKYNKVKDYL